ncbi:MAG TPA: PA2779 family protein, partial [Desulfobacterales bacterium]|nr:PA2779 family protein [Desulfobacterales bacterium]
MKRIYRIARPVSLVLAVYVFMISGPHQAAMAALVGTETVLDGTRVQNARELVRNLMAREDIQAALAQQGIDPQEARARAAALSDAEAVRLADRVESLPAGGDVGALGIVVGTLLIV